jgi:hypothetical protein
MGKKSVDLVPTNLMVPIGADGTKEFGCCADTWNDSQISNLRSRLPLIYHAVPIDWLRAKWINIRKSGTPGYKTNGHGARKYTDRESIGNKEFYTRLHEPDWKHLADEAKRRDGDRCKVCNGDRNLEAHHRTYDTIRTIKEINDLVTLCRRCHIMFHDKIKGLPDDQMELF